MKAFCDEDGWLKVVVGIDFAELIDIGGMVDFNDMMIDKVISEGATLSDISYKPVGILGDIIFVQVIAELMEY